jgi:hypothetical protein
MTDKQNDSTDIEAWATVVREVLGVPSLSHHSAYLAGTVTVRPEPSPQSCACSMSAVHPKAAQERTSREVREGPTAGKKF